MSTPSTYRWFKRPSLLVFVLLVFAILWTQWPMLTGATDSPATQPSKDGISWRSDYDAALNEAQAAGKPLLLDFTADWCPPCQKMKRDVWPDAQVRDLVNSRFIPVYVDIDANEKLAREFQVSAIPTIVIQQTDGSTQRRTGYQSVEQLTKFLSGE